MEADKTHFMDPQISSVPVFEQPESFNSPSRFSSDGGRFSGFFSSLPLPKILIGLILVLILGGFGFAAKTYFFAPKEPEEIVLTYWGLWEDTDTIGQLITEYEAKTPKVKIKYIKQAKEDYRERLANSLTKGDGPDIFRFHNTWVPMMSSNLSSLPSDVMDSSLFQSTFYPTTSKDLQRGTELVGLPLMFDGLGLYINESLFTTNGKSPPATWDDLRKTAQELTLRDEEGRISQSGVALGRADNVDNWEDIVSLMMLQNGVDLTNPTGKLAEDALAFYTVFAGQDHIWDESMPSSTQAFAAGKLAMYFGPSWRAFEIKQQNPNLSFRVVPVPQLPKNSPADPDINWASYWVEGVWVKSKGQHEAWSFLKFLSEKSSLQRLYSTASKSRLFGPVYPRQDMADLIVSDPFTGAYVKEAGTAKSWYLASRTFDGATGINSRLAVYFKDAINGILVDRREPSQVLPTVAAGVSQVLGSYNVTK